jgi:hypothetical protein
VVLGEAQVDLPLFPGVHADRGGVDLRQYAPAPDQEVIPGRGGGLVVLRGQRVVDNHEVTRAGGALHAAELRVLVAHPLEGLVDVGVGHRSERVLDLDAAVLTKRDGRLDLDDRRERERRALLELEILQVRLVDRIDPRLGHRAAVDVGNEMLGDLAADVVGEVQLHERARDPSAPEARQRRALLHAPVGALPFLRHHVDRRLHREPALAPLDLLDGDLHVDSIPSSVSSTSDALSERGARGGS